MQLHTSRIHFSIESSADLTQVHARIPHWYLDDILVRVCIVTLFTSKLSFAGQTVAASEKFKYGPWDICWHLLKAYEGMLRNQMPSVERSPNVLWLPRNGSVKKKKKKGKIEGRGKKKSTKRSVHRKWEVLPWVLLWWLTKCPARRDFVWWPSHKNKLFFCFLSRVTRFAALMAVFTRGPLLLILILLGLLAPASPWNWNGKKRKLSLINKVIPVT